MFGAGQRVLHQEMETKPGRMRVMYVTAAVRDAKASSPAISAVIDTDPPPSYGWPGAAALDFLYRQYPIS